MFQALRGHVQTIFLKNLCHYDVKGGGGGVGVACDAKLFCLSIAFFLLTSTPRFYCNYDNYIARVIYCGVDPLPDANLASPTRRPWQCLIISK